MENDKAQDQSNIDIMFAKNNVPDGVVENLVYEDYDTPSIEYIGENNIQYI